MKEKMIIRTVSCLCIALMACGTAFAQQGKMTSGAYQGPMMPMVTPDAPDAAPFYTNFEANSCTGCNYGTDNGFLDPRTEQLRYPRINTMARLSVRRRRTGAVRRVRLAITDWSILHTHFARVYGCYL